MKIVEAVKEELVEIAELYKEAFAIHNVFSKEVKEIVEYLEELPGSLLAVKEEEKIIGAVYYELGDVCRIKHFAVLPEYRGKRVGSLLMKEVEERIRKEQEKAVIEVHVADEKLVEFYKKHGFEVKEEKPNHYRENEMVWSMQKVL